MVKRNAQGDVRACCVCRRRLCYAFVWRRRSVRCDCCGELCCTECVIARRYTSARDGDITRTDAGTTTPTPTAATSQATTTRSTASTPTHALLCATCSAKPSVLQRLPRSVWELIYSYCNRATQQCLLQLCHTAQMGVVLPYPYYARGWSMLFGTRQVVYEGANGQICRTTLQPGVGDAASSLSSASACSSGEMVAVKVIAKASIYSLRRWEYVQREVTALQRCRHKHVVGFHFAAHGPSEVYIVLQYLPGGDLFDWLVRQQMPLEADVRVIARQLLTTMHYMHEVCGVVHRDIKPENILLDTSAATAGGSACNGLCDRSNNSNNNSNNCTSNRTSHNSGGPYADETNTTLHVRIADFGYCKVLAQPTRAAQRSALSAALACSTTNSAATCIAASIFNASNGSSNSIRCPSIRQSRCTPTGGRGSAADEDDDDGDGARACRGVDVDDGTAAVAVTASLTSCTADLGTFDWIVSSTPCGTLGFAAPEVMRAYAAKQDMIRSGVAAHATQASSAGAGAVAAASTTTTTTGAAVAAATKLLSTASRSLRTCDVSEGNGDEDVDNAMVSDRGGGVGGSSRTAAVTCADATLTATEALKRMDVFAAGVTLCVLLTGCEPFPCHSPVAYMRAVLRGVDFGGLEWSHVSVQAKMLLRSMLAPSAAQRPTVLTCLQSSWLRDVCAPSSMSTAVVTSPPRSQPPRTTTATASSLALTDAVSGTQSASFRNNVHSLCKNRDWLFVQDKAGQVTTLSRSLITSDADAEGGWVQRLAAASTMVAIPPDAVATR